MHESAVLPPERVTIVGVLNVTPDSFSDGGRFVAGDAIRVGAAIAEGRALVEAGADVLDVGGESTRPGSEAVAIDREIARTAPVIEALAKELEVPISIDTRKAPVAEAGLEAGAEIVNDVSGGGFDPGLLDQVARHRARCVIGHLRGTPQDMQRQVQFEDVLAEVVAELRAAASRAQQAGVARERISVDPGIGFGKRLPENLALLANLGRLRQEIGLPVWVGASRKSFLGELTGDPVGSRDLASHVVAGIAVYQGVDAVRVHDVAGARRAVQVAQALAAARRGAS